MVHHGKSASCLHVWKLSSPREPCFPMALLWHEFWPFTLKAGTILGKAVIFRSAYNKISLLFQLTWQTPWRTNAYNCQRLVWDLINVVFFQVQFPKAKWRLQSPSTNAGTWPPHGHPDIGCYFSATFREVLSKTKAIWIYRARWEEKSTFWGWHHQLPDSGGLFIYYVIMAQMYTLLQNLPWKFKHLCNPCLQSTQRN